MSSKPPAQFAFSAPIQQAIQELGYTEWTPIQEMSIPLILEGRDVIGQSHTGSGKTAAFGLPIIEKLKPTGKVQVLILVPTRELAEQVMQQMRKFAKHKRTSITPVYGGAGMMPQIHHLRRTDVVVGTPGRILDHLNRGTFNPSQVHTLVLDEADRMLDMGFIRDMRKIIERLPKERQTLLFSATLSSEIRDISKHYLKDPEMVKAQVHVDHGKLTQTYYDLDRATDQKFGLLMHIMKTEKPPLAIIFCGTRHKVDAVERNLNAQGIVSKAIHGGLSQSQRKRALEEFHQGKFHVLVASDVAARGLDIKNVSHIIHYDIPHTPSEYTHRSGRTARAGEEGKIISILTQPDYTYFRVIVRDKTNTITETPVPAFETVPFQKKIKRELEHEHANRNAAHARGPRHSNPRGFGGKPHFKKRENSFPREESAKTGFAPKKKNFRPGKGNSFSPQSLHGNKKWEPRPARGKSRGEFRPGQGRGRKEESPRITKHFGQKHAKD